jgi:small subunit ribosomal protein S3
MARTEEYKRKNSLHTWRADIDYAILKHKQCMEKSVSKYGFASGEVYGKKDLTGAFAGEEKQEKRRPKGPGRWAEVERETKNSE